MLEDRVRLGIIGLGNLTANLMQKVFDIPNIGAIYAFNHGSSTFGTKLEAHRHAVVTKFDSLSGSRRSSLPRDWRRFLPEEKGNEDSFAEFMDNVDVIILNAGGFTSQYLFDRTSSSYAHDFEHLAGFVRNLSDGRNVRDVRDLEVQYNILEELRKLRQEGYYENAFRLLHMFPATLPIVSRYAKMMREYFDQTEVDPRTKFLIVNSNSSENCLDAVLSLIPEFSDSAVSLAVDSIRLNALLNLDPRIANRLSPNVYLRATTSGDHDGYIRPEIDDLLSIFLADVYEGKQVNFREWFENNKHGLEKDLRELVTSYYRRMSGTSIDLLEHAGDGNAHIIRSLFSGESINGGFFVDLGDTELGKRNGLQQGDGLTVVGSYRVETDSLSTDLNGGTTYRVVPIKTPSLDDGQEVGIKAHLRLHRALVDNPYIPINGFPSRGKVSGRSYGMSRETQGVEQKRGYVIIPTKVNGGSRVISYDVASGEFTELAGFDDDTLRALNRIELNGKKYIGCSFRGDLVLVDLENGNKVTMKEFAGVDLETEIAKSLMGLEDSRIRQSNVNSSASFNDGIYLAHTLAGVFVIRQDSTSSREFTVDTEGIEGSIKRYNETSFGSTRGVSCSNGLVYFTSGKKLFFGDLEKMSQEDGKISGINIDVDRVTSPAVFDSNNGFFYVASDSNRKNKVLKVKLDGNAEVIYASDSRSPIRQMKQFRYKGKDCLIISEGDSVKLLSSDGMQLGRFSTDRSVRGMAHALFTYSIDRNFSSTWGTRFLYQHDWHDGRTERIEIPNDLGRLGYDLEILTR